MRKFLVVAGFSLFTSVIYCQNKNLDLTIKDSECKNGNTLSITDRDSIRAKNIKAIDSSLKKVVLTESDKKLLVVINMEEYTYDDYQAQKQSLEVLTKAVVNQISLIKGQAAETLSKAFKHDTKDGVLFITLGDAKPENPLKKVEK